jgi:hypothetical protein
LEQKYQVLSEKYDKGMRDMLDSINKFDFINSGTPILGVTDVMKSLGDMMGGITGLGSLYMDIQTFKGEVARYKGSEV